MRTTLRIDDDLLRELKTRAQRENVSIAQLMNRVIRQGLQTPAAKGGPFRQKTFDLGTPLVNLDKALSLAGELDDEAVLKKIETPMKLIDVNILLYAVNRRDPQHTGILRWWERALAGDEPVGLCWIVLLGFLRIATNPRALSRPLSIVEAAEQVSAWLAHPNTQIVGETPKHWSALEELLKTSVAKANLTMDAHLAAMAICHQATLVSCDADFSRFPQLRWQHPLGTR